MGWLFGALLCAALSFDGGLQAKLNSITSPTSGSLSDELVEPGSPVIDEITFEGLRHIAPAAVQAQLSSRAGAPLDLRKIQSDVKTLGRLGWFDDVQVEEFFAVPSSAELNRKLRILFRVHELPELSGVEYAGSRLLSASQIAKLLEEKRLSPKLGEPADDVLLHRIANAIGTALAELGHPQSQVQIRRDESPNGMVHVRYEIHDGPHLPVGRIVFEGDTAVAKRTLTHEMRRTSPGAMFASWRGKGVFTPAGFAEDRSRILTFYQDQGFPEARVGDARSSVYEANSRRSAFWPFRRTEQRLAVNVPIEAGPYYRVKSVKVGPELSAAGGKRARKLLVYSTAHNGSAYSARTVEDLRHLWVVATEPRHDRSSAQRQRAVEAERIFDTDAHEARLRFTFSDAPPDIVRRVEFRGNHRFSDRYLRRRIGLEEGLPFDERELELGLAQLAKTGYFHQIHKEDIHVDRNELTHSVNVTIRVSEAGQQRTSFSGGRGQFGSTLGFAYSLFDVLQREELLSAQVDIGPESLQTVLSLVMEEFLGSRSSLAISVFETVVRPRFATSARGPFYTSRSEGINTAWSYPLTPTDALSVQYGLAHSKTDYSVSLPPSLAGLPSSHLTTQSTSSAIGLTLNHDARSNRFVIANSVSGGMLGGTENLIRSNEEYARIVRDRFSRRQNAWALRAVFSGAESYRGDLPISERFFSGNAQVRGLGPGELGPYAVIPTAIASGGQAYTAIPSGANLVSAANLEYRIPLQGKVQAAGFFDLGSGWLLPNWLGKSRPTLLDSTNGVLHGSLGIELRWTVPEIQVPVRAYYCVNVLRLNRFLPLSDGTMFHAHNKLLAFGWALGSLF